MKKLMIAFAAVAVAACAQAASINWAATGIKTYVEPTSSTAATGYAAYLINNATVARETMISALGQGDTSKIATAMVSSDASATTANGNIVKQGVGTFDSGTSMTLYTVIFDNADYTKAKHAYVTTTKTASTGGSGQAANFGFGMQGGTATASNWTTIPEPTSAMLMLLGVAGLALKRKRA